MTTELTSSERTDRTLRLAFPWGIWIRRVILAALVVLVVVAAIKTFTLPADAPPGELSRYTSATWRSFIIGGLSEGAVLALIALGYSLVYGILRMINFAHGEVFMMGAFASYFVADRFNDNDLLSSNPAVAMVVILAVAIGSSAEQGSSIRMISGFTAMARAMQSRCCCPPDRLVPE